MLLSWNTFQGVLISFNVVCSVDLVDTLYIQRASVFRGTESVNCGTESVNCGICKMRNGGFCVLISVSTAGPFKKARAIGICSGYFNRNHNFNHKSIGLLIGV